MLVKFFTSTTTRDSFYKFEKERMGKHPKTDEEWTEMGKYFVCILGRVKYVLIVSEITQRQLYIFLFKKNVSPDDKNVIFEILTSDTSLIKQSKFKFSRLSRSLFVTTVNHPAIRRRVFLRNVGKSN